MKKTLTLLTFVLSFASLLAAPIRGIMCFKETLEGASPLPYGAIPVEYIQSTGSGQYIDTGIAPNGQTKWVLDAMFPSNASFMPMGAVATNPTRRFVIANEGGGRTSLSFGFLDNIVNINSRGVRRTFVIDAENFTWEVDGVYGVYSEGPFDITGIGNIFLFARSRDGVVNSTNADTRLYGCTIHISGEPVRNFIPVRFPNRFGEWEGALLDLVSGDLYRNQGRGSFIIGPDL